MKRSKTSAAKFPPPDEFRWRAGPYRPPAVKVGTVLHDEYRGDVTVDGMTNAPVPWPGSNYNRGRNESLLPILCGDLVRAVCEEDELTVSHYWGVTRYMVEQWKRAIAEAKDSNRVFFNLTKKRNDPDFRRKYGYP